LRFAFAFVALAASLVGTAAAMSPASLIEQPGGRLQSVRDVEEMIAKWRQRQDKESEDAQWTHADFLDALSQRHAFAGNPVAAASTYDEGMRLSERLRKLNNDAAPAQLAAIQNAKAEEAIAAILKAAEGRQIVILNEAHHAPQHRAFAMKLARELRRMGFEYLACETFAIDHPSPMAKGYVRLNEGFFSRESMYATFLKDAAADGWKFVTYEPGRSAGMTGAQHSRQRDALMARNIIARVLDKNPKARIFAYVGFGHGSKMPAAQNDDDQTRMGAQLRRLSGIDPLSIDQVTLFASYKSREQNALYRAAIKHHPHATPFVLSSSAGVFLTVGSLPGQYDLQVVHPDYPIDRSTLRPTWMRDLARLVPLRAPADMFPKKGQRLLYAFPANTPDDAIALDIISVKAGEAAPKFMLPPGQYRYRFEE
jgi:hypothetical protein